MSIENLLGDLLAAFKENTAALAAHTDLLNKLSSSKAASTTPAPVTKTPSAEPEAEEDSPKPRTRATKAAAEPAPTKRAAAPKVKATTEKDMVEKTKAFLDAAYEGLADDEDPSDDQEAEFEARKAFVKKVLAKHGGGAGKMSLVEEGLRQACLDALEGYEPEEDVA